MWDPFRDVDRLLGRLRLPTGPGFLSTSARGSWIPAMDILEKNDSYKIFTDVPGMDRADISVDVEGNRLCVGGTRKSAIKEDEENMMIMAERGTGRFERCVEFPSHIREETVQATLRDAVLVVEVKKSTAAEDRVSKSVRIQ